ncbi:MAG: NAD(P)/FAD-dependent oxidoreductase [Verrucomicrobia bacterium]|nr:NAD(P)/FAD-dependent oxidoreductase [Verrucomicrobiota bacterium]
MKRVVIAGGGAAGFFAAIGCAHACAASRQPVEVVLLERGDDFLTKVRISGGGRCNVTHACFDSRELAAYYPRGGRALIGPLQRFGPAETVEWFKTRGVMLKTESDGRMFPTTDASQTIIDCFLRSALDAGVLLTARCGVESATRLPGGGFALTLSDGRALVCDRLLLATGGPRSIGAAPTLAESLGHTLEPPVPSLFTFRVETPWLRALSGVSVEPVEVSVPGTRLRERGPVLATHWGLSGPAVLRLSAWGARALHALEYRFPLQINWLPEFSQEALGIELQARAGSQPAGLVVKAPVRPIPQRLWEQLVLAAGVAPETRWGAFPRAALQRLLLQLTRTEFQVTGKSANKAEFVTCGGVRLGEVDLKTMQSRIAPGLFFAGELLDIDGLTGGFNFQAAWTTGWIAGQSMAV